MIADIRTVIWKECREVLAWGGPRGRLGILMVPLVFGVFLPWQTGRAWVESPIALVYWAWVPLFLVSSVIADAIAGERERHTLETLLASRLSNRAILLGKVAAAVGYGVGLSWLSLLLGLVTVNVAHGQGALLLYPLAVGFGIVTFSVLGASLAAAAGVLISLRAATARQAQQTLSIATMLLLFVPVFGLQALPQEWQARLFETLASMELMSLVFIVAAILGCLTAGLLAVGMARFQRAQLILD